MSQPQEAAEGEERLRDLAARASAGDAIALEAFLAACRPLLRSAAERRIPRRMPLDAADVTQNALLKIASRISTKRVPNGRPIAAWLNTVAEDCFVDAVRAEFGRKRDDGRGRPAVYSLDDAMASVAGSSVALRQLVSNSSTPDRRALKNERDEGIGRALERLSPEDRQVVVLRVCCGLSNAQVAETLEMTPAALSKRLARAIVRLRG